MKFVAVSDTHGCHRQLELPTGDVIVHAGDVCDRGDRDQAADFFEWLSEVDFEHKIVIWGNHDFDLTSGRLLFPSPMIDGVTVLDGSAYRIGELVIWGTPTPANKRGEDWSAIPADVDILVTHRPPQGILDRPRVRGPQGSRGLAERVRQLQPRVHLFGHIHRSYGQMVIGSTTYINASTYRSTAGRLVNPAVTFELS